MLDREKRFLKNWMLPLAMTTGVAVYLVLHYVPSFDDTSYINIARKLQPLLVSIMLFLQLNVVAPTDLRFHRWHFRLLAVQALFFAAAAFISIEKYILENSEYYKGEFKNGLILLMLFLV